VFTITEIALKIGNAVPPTRLITRAPNTAYVGVDAPSVGRAVDLSYAAPLAIAVYRISRVFVCCPTAMYTNPR
jgi:hypothetical protein